jgi:hypothetical protein
MDMHRKLLEELIYERVCLHVDLSELLDFERDLNESIERAMKACGVEDPHADDLGRHYIEMAWRRIEADWERERSGGDECPLCDGIYQCPSGMA